MELLKFISYSKIRVSRLLYVPEVLRSVWNDNPKIQESVRIIESPRNSQVLAAIRGTVKVYGSEDSTRRHKNPSTWGFFNITRILRLWSLYDYPSDNTQDSLIKCWMDFFFLCRYYFCNSSGQSLVDRVYSTNPLSFLPTSTPWNEMIHPSIDERSEPSDFDMYWQSDSSKCENEKKTWGKINHGHLKGIKLWGTAVNRLNTHRAMILLGCPDNATRWKGKLLKSLPRGVLATN